jgi:hypothetical protein
MLNPKIKDRLDPICGEFYDKIAQYVEEKESCEVCFKVNIYKGGLRNACLLQEHPRTIKKIG